ncbi:12726_t:CDS:1, partial [Cetraspora pellucida]
KSREWGLYISLLFCAEIIEASMTPNSSSYSLEMLLAWIA